MIRIFSTYLNGHDHEEDECGGEGDDEGRFCRTGESEPEIATEATGSRSVLLSVPSEARMWDTHHYLRLCPLTEKTFNPLLSQYSHDVILSGRWQMMQGAFSSPEKKEA